MKKLENLQWSPKWVSHLGCIKGCLDYLGMDVSDAWLYGGTGHAFVINLHEGVCPSGPTAWDSAKLFELGKNLGYVIDGVCGHKSQDGFAGLQEQAWEHVRQAIDRGQPCYGWELEIPEFYVIYGYDETGYYYSGPGCDEGRGPKPWREVGDTGIGMLELYSVRPGEAADDAQTVRDAFSFALKHAQNPKDWVFGDYRSGPEGFDNWVRALQEGKASDMGTRYNAGVWLECRKCAVGFLEEAKERLAGRADDLFDEALAHYGAVAESLGQVAEIYPWRLEASDEDVLPVDGQSHASVEALKAARKAEVDGLRTLDKIIQVL